MSAQASDNRSARDRLLGAAGELFYEHGVHTVGIDKVIERAGVAKASLYSAFGSKEELIRAYLEDRHAIRKARVLEEFDRHDDPRDRLLAVFDVLSETVARPTFRGCAFANASAESEPNSAAADVTRKVRAWLLEVLVDQASEMGIADPEALALQLALLYDGALVRSSLEPGPSSANAAKTAAAVLIDTAPRAPKSRARTQRQRDQAAT
jgi:AcrR family transcriptional regulator